MRTRVKICGVTNLADARRAVAFGADWLGFNFYPGSPRCIAPARAAAIIRKLPRRVRSIGVFRDEPRARIASVVRQAGLAGVQLHGRESARTIAALARRFPVWKAVRVRGAFRTASLEKYRAAEAILLDAFRPGVPGGTGRTFDWTVAARARQHARIILAGGLTPENVGDAVRTARPFAVDVASGVELRAGKKDARKMRRFIAAVRAADRAGRKR
jgi:phosphoribosylanthranilate isomerase